MPAKDEAHVILALQICKKLCVRHIGHVLAREFGARCGSLVLVYRSTTHDLTIIRKLCGKVCDDLETCSFSIRRCLLGRVACLPKSAHFPETAIARIHVSLIATFTLILMYDWDTHFRRC